MQLCVLYFGGCNSQRDEIANFVQDSDGLFCWEKIVFKTVMFPYVKTVENERKRLKMATRSFPVSFSLILDRTEWSGLISLHCADQVDFISHSHWNVVEMLVPLAGMQVWYFSALCLQNWHKRTSCTQICKWFCRYVQVLWWRFADINLPLNFSMSLCPSCQSW